MNGVRFCRHEAPPQVSGHFGVSDCAVQVPPGALGAEVADRRRVENIAGACCRGDRVYHPAGPRCPAQQPRSTLTHDEHHPEVSQAATSWALVATFNPAARAATAPSTLQSASSSPCARPSIIRSRTRLAMGSGTLLVAGGFEHERHVLQPERQPKPGGMVALVRDQTSICLVDRRGEKRRGEHVDERVRIDAALTRERERFAEAFDDRRDQEISRQLHDVGMLGLLAEAKRPLPDGVENRLQAVERGPGTGAHHKQLRLGGGIRPAEYRRRHVVPPCAWCAAASRCERRTLIVLIETWISAWWQQVDQASLERYLLDGRVVGQHRDHDVGSARVGRRGGRRGTGGHEVVSALRRTVPDGEIEAGLQQICGHRPAHVAEPDETDSHDSLRVHVLRSQRTRTADVLRC